MDDVLKIEIPVPRCPKCGAVINGPVHRLACIPPIYQYPCGCKVQYVPAENGK